MEPRDLARSADLRYVHDAMPGYRRLRWGRGFTYRDPDDRTVKERSLRQRFESLAIPPAWAEVWICRDHCGHLQVTGRDEKQRKQYIYHPRWLEIANRKKFDRMLDFGRALPALRRRVATDLARGDLSPECVTAGAIRVLDQALIRVGNARYARTNGSHGLTTLRTRHAELGPCRVQLHYTAKSSQERDVDLSDCRVASLLRRCHELPGQDLFQYRSDDDTVCSLTSGDVNDYLDESTRDRVAGEKVTAKDFRTWGGTVMATALAATREPAEDPSSPDAASRRAEIVREVAEALGNTPATARKYYIHPEVFPSWEDGRLAALADGFETDGLETDGSALDADEQLTIALLESLREERRAA